MTYSVKAGELNAARLTGSVRFHAKGIYAGEVNFVVEVNSNTDLEVVEFSLPNYGITIHKQDDGTWMRKTPSATLPDDSTANNDREAIQGQWQVVFMEANGNVVQQGLAQLIQIVFEGDVMRTLPDNEEMRFTLDPESSPATIDYAGDEPVKGIYELKGDTLRLCESKGERPDDFESTQDTTLFRLKRVSGTAAPLGSVYLVYSNLDIQSVKRMQDGQLRFLVPSFGGDDVELPRCEPQTDRSGNRAVVPARDVGQGRCESRSA